MNRLIAENEKPPKNLRICSNDIINEEGIPPEPIVIIKTPEKKEETKIITPPPKQQKKSKSKPKPKPSKPKTPSPKEEKKEAKPEPEIVKKEIIAEEESEEESEEEIEEDEFFIEFDIPEYLIPSDLSKPCKYKLNKSKRVWEVIQKMLRDFKISEKLKKYNKEVSNFILLINTKEIEHLILNPLLPLNVLLSYYRKHLYIQKI